MRDDYKFATIIHLVFMPIRDSVALLGAEKLSFGLLPTTTPKNLITVTTPSLLFD